MKSEKNFSVALKQDRPDLYQQLKQIAIQTQKADRSRYDKTTQDKILANLKYRLKSMKVDNS
jgi:hypothetical protein